MSNTQSHDMLPVVLSIPPETLAELRTRRSQRKPAADARTDRPILTTVGMMMAAGTVDPQDAARMFCEDMDRLQAEVEDEYDAFLLDPGMGPMTYITSRGGILCDYRTWDGEGIQYETNPDRVIPTLVIGAKNTGIHSLLDMIPKLENAMPCTTCNGTRWFQLPKGEIVCPTCSGRGECQR